MSGNEDVFKSIGLHEEKAKETAGNKKLCASLLSILEDAGIGNKGCEKSMGVLFYELASTVLKDVDAKDNQKYISALIADGSLKTRDQLVAAVAYFKKKGANVVVEGGNRGVVDEKEFKDACGIGVVVGVEEVRERIEQMIISDKERIVEERYKTFATLLKGAREDERLKWADGKMVKDALDEALLRLLGPKDERDVPQKKKKEKNPVEVKKKESEPKLDVNPWICDYKTDPFYHQSDLSKLHKPGGNRQIKPELMEQHLKETGGKVMSRFPPEPNGHLHIGHAKAINVNFGFALANDGNCYLRYDDTNPEAEEEEYFKSIIESVEWLGYKPWKITYSSDHFQRLYDLAVELIRKDKAYVCHCTGEEIHEQRGGDAKGPRTESKWRNRPVEESLREFKKMKEGYYKEGEAILRMKMDLQNPNPQMWDLVAYRVLYTPHYRTGKDWCIYPTYDYTHCLCDSFENITHSMCTTEFTASRESYYWLVDALELYKPVQWEYGRLNLTNTVLSKRKLTKLVSEKIVDGWDDPRLYTLIALKRRGFPPQAINKFVRDCGISNANSTIDVRRLEFVVRQYLDDHCPRVMAIVRPITVFLSNLSSEHYEEFRVSYLPKSKQNSMTLDVPEARAVPFTNTLFLDASDFKEDGANDPNFFRLAVGSTVGLLNVPYPIYCKEAIHDSNGNILALHCLYLTPETVQSLAVDAQTLKPKAHIQWVALSQPSPSHPNRINSPIKSELRMYNDLFLHSNPMDKTEVPGGWLSDINPNSLEVYKGYVEAGVGKGCDGSLGLGVEGRVQFVRIGYFCVDKTSTFKAGEDTEFDVPYLASDGKIAFKKQILAKNSGWVWNKTVGLREDTKKQ